MFMSNAFFTEKICKKRKDSEFGSMTLRNGATMIRLVLFLSIFVFIDFTSCKSTVKVNNTDPSYDYNDYDDYESDNDDDTIDYESVYDLIRDELPEVLTQVERKYKTHIQHHHGEHVHGEHPLLSLVSQADKHPDSFNQFCDLQVLSTLQVKGKVF